MHVKVAFALLALAVVLPRLNLLFLWFPWSTHHLDLVHLYTSSSFPCCWIFVTHHHNAKFLPPAHFHASQFTAPAPLFLPSSLLPAPAPLLPAPAPLLPAPPRPLLPSHTFPLPRSCSPCSSFDSHSCSSCPHSNPSTRL
ncbi:hypothetical protein CVS40_8525 [Lucilia cuprina]|nr:hypothetical protein CVS40_8525 [Lucilia cuprina]